MRNSCQVNKAKQGTKERMLRDAMFAKSVSQLNLN